MTTSNPAPRYDATLRTLHWAMAAIILTAIALGVVAALLPRGVSPRVEILTIHKSLGMTALVLIVLRVAWRLAVRAPPYSAALGALHRLGADAAHVALYALMIAMPVTGYVNLSSAAIRRPGSGCSTGRRRSRATTRSPTRPASSTTGWRGLSARRWRCISPPWPGTSG